MSDAALERLRSRAASALRGLRGDNTLLVSVSERHDELPDVADFALSARGANDRWFVLEQPERGDSVIAGLGAAVELHAEGPDRFRELERAWLRLSERADADDVSGPPGTGIIAVGGLAFAHHGASSEQWRDFGNASLTVPELALCGRDGEVWVTATLALASGTDAEQALERLRSCRMYRPSPPVPPSEPQRAGPQISSPLPAEGYEQAVTEALERIRAGEIQKVVLARQVEVRAANDHDPATVFKALRERFPACFIYAVGRGSRTFIGATPELLIRREGERASTVALAGTTGRSEDDAIDARLGEELLNSHKNRNENLIVARRIASALRPFSVWVTVAPEPMLIKVANVQHLAAPIRAQLKSTTGTLQLAGSLHPTPAVGGEPAAVAQAMIPGLEGFDRGWYAGTVGWLDRAGDGEFCVALRCALLDGPSATCYAGAGIVDGSDPAAEFAETEVKLQAMLPILGAAGR